MMLFSNVSSVFRFVIRFHIGILIGGAFFIVALLLYRSYENRPIFNLWSYPFFAFLVVIICLYITFLLCSFGSILILNKKKSKPVKIESCFFETAIFFFGLSYFLSAFDDQRNGARVLNLVFLGSSDPASIILAWLSLLMVFCMVCAFILHFHDSNYSNILLVLISFFALTVLLEGALRLKAILSPEVQGFPTYTTDCWHRRYVKLNSAGFRDIEHSALKPEGTSRILVVGDSYAKGHGIERIEMRFGELLAKTLGERTGRNWEAITMARGDTHTIEHIEFLKKGLRYCPDAIILLYVFNDIDYLYPVTPRSIYNHLLSITSLTGLLYRNFFLFQELFIRLRNIKYKYKIKTDKAIAAYRNKPVVSEHLKHVFEFVKLAREKGALVQVVPFDFLPLREEIYSEFVDAARRVGIPILSIFRSFEGIELSELVVNEFDAHPNETANALAVRVVAERLLENLSPIE